MASILASLLLIAAAQPASGPAPANGDAAAVAAACGGEIYDADIARMSKAALAARLACFTREAANGLNRQLPQRIDKATLLQRVSAEGTTLTYHYSVDLLSSELKPGALDAFKPNVIAKVCAATDMRRIISIGGSYRYIWLDRNGVTLGDLVVSSC
ncbi:MAG TPA: hypothetical protein VFW19_08445 [Allosphingosinicella sp.]|nr:hypothetical protein [Allosphingosinicella sp.]